MEGILSETGGEAAITGDCVVVASEDGAAGDAADSTVDAADEATADGISEAEGCAGAVLVQPVRTTRATPTEAKTPLWGCLLELII